MTQLPFCTEPILDEGPYSWLLRVTRDNLLHSPRPLLRLAGYQNGMPSIARDELYQVAAIAGVPAEKIAPLLCTPCSGASKYVHLRGHIVPTWTIRRAKCQLCPRCLAERGYARAAWDLFLMAACPEHRLRLLSRCPACKRGISWLRSDLQLCPCGFDFTQAEADPATPAEIASSAALEACLFGSTKVWTEHVGPTNELLEFFARTTLLGAHYALAWLARLKSGSRSYFCSSALERIADNSGDAFVNWPQGLYSSLDARILRGFGITGSRNSPEKNALVVRTQIRSIRTMLGENGGLFDDEVTRYFGLRFPDALMDTKAANALRALGVELRWISMLEGAKRLGVGGAVMRRMIADGLIEHRRTPDMHTKVFVRTDQLKPELSQHKFYKRHDVAGILGVPEVVIHDLIAEGLLAGCAVRSESPSIASYDLERFLSRWEQSGSIDMPEPDDTVSLHGALNDSSPGYHSSWRRLLIRRLLYGQVPLWHVCARPWLDGRVRLDDVLQARVDCQFSTVTLGGACHAMNLSKMAVLRLIVDGHLKAIMSKPELAIRRDEIKQFLTKRLRVYKHVGSSNRAAQIVEVCQANHVDILRVGPKPHSELYVLRSDASRLHELLAPSVNCVPAPAWTRITPTTVSTSYRKATCDEARSIAAQSGG